ncbi:Homeobox-leucine zipper protein hat22 [Sarracenia purpurea var. burkii]
MVFNEDVLPDTVLTLGSISSTDKTQKKKKKKKEEKEKKKKLVSPLKLDDHVFFPSDLTLGLSSSTVSISAASSYTNSSVKRERDLSLSGEEEEEEDVEVQNLEMNQRVSSKASDDQEGSAARKTLRLTKEQSAVLEDSFKGHTTLNPKQKQALAKQLNLRPRQVEVWFQNRRARTKVKQTEVECELLKKSCEILTDENRRLQKEMQELKALKMSATPFYLRIPAATITMCPSCNRVNGGKNDRDSDSDGRNGDNSDSKGSGRSSSKMTPFSIKAKPANFYNLITHPFAAC